MVNNLHSLLNGPWYIHQQYGEAMLPLLFNMLNGKDFTKQENVAHSIESASSSSTTNTSNNDVLVISIKSPIYKYSQECGPRGTKTMMAIMDRFKKDATIAGVVLDIDSGGGQVSGTPEFHDYIKTYPKPVVSYTDGMMCSAAYYIGSAAQHIVANKRASDIGSIGAYTQFLDLKGYYEKQGATLHTMYATKSTGKNKEYREALEGNYEAYITQVLDPIVEEFITDIKEVRNQVNETVFTGGTYAASIALKNGLIDEIGTFETAVNKVLELAKTNKNNTMNTGKKRTNLDAVLGLEEPLAVTDNGSYLNEDQLDAVETHLADQNTIVADAQAAQQTAETALEAATEAATEVTNSLNALAEEHGIELADGEDIIFSISAHIAALGKNDGDKTTTVSVDTENGSKAPVIEVGGIKIDEYLNN